MSEPLTREQVERECRWHVEEHASDSARKWLSTDAALRAQLHTQTELWRKTNAEYEWVNKAMCHVQTELVSQTERAEMAEAERTKFEQLIAELTDKVDVLQESRETDLSEYLRKHAVHSQQLAEAQATIAGLKGELNDKDTVPRSRYNACNKDWLDGQVEHKILLEKTKVSIENDTKTIARLSQERDQLQATVTAQAEEITRLSLAGKAWRGTE